VFNSLGVNPTGQKSNCAKNEQFYISHSAIFDHKIRTMKQDNTAGRTLRIGESFFEFIQSEGEIIVTETVTRSRLF